MPIIDVKNCFARYRCVVCADVAIERPVKLCCKTPLVSDSFEVPVFVNTDFCIVRPLTIHDMFLDYEAYASNVAHANSFIQPAAHVTTEWSLVDEIVALGWHQKEFERRTSFTYTVLSPDERRCIGCIYIYPSSRRGFDAEVYFWVTMVDHEAGVDVMLSRTVYRWLEEVWPFEKVAYPGREITWKEWLKLDTCC